MTGDREALDTGGIKMVLRRIGTETGIHVHAHKCRHTLANGRSEPRGSLVV